MTTIQSLFPLPPNFPDTEALRQISKTENPDASLLNYIESSNKQYYRFLENALHPDAKQWYNDRATRIKDLIMLFIKQDEEEQGDFRIQLLYKKRAERIHDLFLFTKVPDNQHFILKEKREECLTVFEKIQSQILANSDTEMLEKLSSFFPKNTDLSGPVDQQLIISRLGNSKEFEKFTFEFSIRYFDYCLYTPLYIFESPHKADALDKLEIYKKNPEKLSKLVRDLVSFNFSLETTGYQAANIRDIIGLLEEGNPRIPRHETYLLLLKTKLKAALEPRVIRKDADNFMENVKLLILLQSDDLIKVCEKILPLDELALLPPSDCRNPNEYVTQALNRIKPHTYLIGLYAWATKCFSQTIVNQSEKSKDDRTDVYSDPPGESLYAAPEMRDDLSHMTIEEFLVNYRTDTPPPFRYLEGLQALINSDEHHPRKYYSFLPVGFLGWYPDLVSEFTAREYLDTIFSMHSAELNYFLSRSDRFCSHIQGVQAQQEIVQAQQEKSLIRSQAMCFENLEDFKDGEIGDFETRCNQPASNDSVTFGEMGDFQVITPISARDIASKVTFLIRSEDPVGAVKYLDSIYSMLYPELLLELHECLDLTEKEVKSIKDVLDQDPPLCLKFQKVLGQEKEA